MAGITQKTCGALFSLWFVKMMNEWVFFLVCMIVFAVGIHSSNYRDNNDDNSCNNSISINNINISSSNSNNNNINRGAATRGVL